MIYILGHAVVSPLGYTTEEHCRAIVAGQSSIMPYPAGTMGVPFPFSASLFDSLLLEERAAGYCGAMTHMYGKVQQALELAFGQAVNSSIDNFFKSQIYNNKRILFVVCANKGGVELLEKKDQMTFPPQIYPWHIVQRMMAEHGVVSEPIVLTNSAVTGAYGFQIAQEMLESTDRFDYVVLCGVELVPQRTLAGFHTMGVLSETRCKPFDVTRNGMNLGEAAACVILASEKAYRRDKHAYVKASHTMFVKGACCNDAYDVSKPYLLGEGLYRSLKKVLANTSLKEIAFVNAFANGTVTGDNSESIALERAGLSKIPVTSYKANLGYSSGASGLVDCLISLKALENDLVLPTLGCEKVGVDGRIDVVKTTRHIPSNKTSFLKVSRGYGGVNSASLFTKFSE